MSSPAVSRFPFSVEIVPVVSVTMAWSDYEEIPKRQIRCQYISVFVDHLLLSHTLKAFHLPDR